MKNGIPLGMGCGSSAAGRLAAIALAVHFGQLGWSSEQHSRRGLCAGGPSGQRRGLLAGRICGRCLRGPDGACGARCASGGVAGYRCSSCRAPGDQQGPRGAARRATRVADVVANIQSAALLGLAFAQGRGDLLRIAMRDRIHQPYRAAHLPAAAAPAAAGGEARDSGRGAERRGACGAGDCRTARRELDEASAAIREALDGVAEPELMVCRFEPAGAGRSIES